MRGSHRESFDGRADRWTLADLAVLIAGAAVVLAVPWMNRLEFLEWTRVGPMHRWLEPRLGLLGEVIGKVALALVPVAVVRAARRGEAVRPGAFLLACAGLPWLAQGIHDGLMLAWFWGRGIRVDMAGIPASQASAWRAWEVPRFRWAGVLGLVGASLSLVAGRRRLPGWAISVLLMVAWLGAHEFFLPQRWQTPVTWLLTPVLETPPLVREAVYSTALWLPLFLLFAAPLASALTGRRGGRSWLDRAGRGLGIAYILCESIPLTVIRMSTGRRSDRLPDLLGLVLPFVLAAGLGLWTSSQLLPAWRRFLGVEQETGDEPRGDGAPGPRPEPPSIEPATSA